MNIYFCKRAEESWTGGLIIQAASKERAEELFEERETYVPFQTYMISIEGEGILHDHDY